MKRLTSRERDRRNRRRKARRLASRLQAAGEQPTWLSGSIGDVDFAAAGEGAATDAPKKFTMTLYRGGRMRPSGFYCDVVVDLAGCKVAAGTSPAFLEHDRSKLVGHQTITNDGRGITSAGVISGGGDAAREVEVSASKGFPWKSSIGGSIEELHFIEKGETAECNGRTWKGPIFVVRAMTVYEGSFVSIAGDPSSSAKIAAQLAATQGAEVMGFSAWLKAKGFDEAALSDGQKKSLRAMFDAEMQAAGQPSGDLPAGNGGAPLAASGAVPPVTTGAPPATPAVPATLTASIRDEILGELRAGLGQIRSEAAAEQNRHSAIRRFATQYEVTQIEADGAKVDFVAHAIEKGWSLEKAELEAMRGGRPSVGPAVHVVGGGLNYEALEASLCLSASMSEKFVSEQVPTAQREQVMNLASSREYRGTGIQTLMYDTIRAAGGYARPGTITDDVIRTFLRASQQLQAAGQSTGNPAGILGNVANKALLNQYRAVADTVGLIAKKATAGDFKTMTRYRLTGDATFLEVSPNGQIRSFELGEDSYTNAIKTYGRSIMLNRQMMRGDDLGAFLQLPEILGRGAALCRNKGTFTLILSNPGSPAFFSTNNNNYFSGAATNLQVTSLTTAEKMFLELKDSKGNFIEGMPAILLVPPAIKVIGDQLYKDTVVNETTTAGVPKPNSNPHAGKFRVISTPYLGTASGIANASDTAFYMAADPNDVPFLEIAYLDGNETPTLQSSEADFDTLGMKWRSFWDFGVALANKTGAVMSKGAA